MPVFILAVPRAPKPLDPRYETNFVDIKKLSSITLYVLREASGSVLRKYIITIVILFLPKGCYDRAGMSVAVMVRSSTRE